jgi:hypothetical protein
MAQLTDSWMQQLSTDRDNFSIKHCDVQQEEKVALFLCISLYCIADVWKV